MTGTATSKPNQHSVLVVEDDDSLRSILIDNLSRRGFTAHEAHNGDVGLYKMVKHKPDIVLLDLLLPEMSGLELLTIIRKHSWGKKVPVIVLTNVDDIAVMNECIKRGVKYHFIKSNTSIGFVIETINSQLQKQLPKDA